MNRHAEAHARNMIGRPRRRWCSTTLGGNRADHPTIAEARDRADDLAAILAADNPPAGAADRLTVWYRDEGDPRGWQSLRVIDLRERAGLGSGDSRG